MPAADPDDRSPDTEDDADAPDHTAPALKELTAIIAKGAGPARCREAVLAHHNRWRTDLGKEEADLLAAELRDKLAEGLEQAEEGAADYTAEADDKDGPAMKAMLAAQIVGMRAAHDCAARIAG